MEAVARLDNSQIPFRADFELQQSYPPRNAVQHRPQRAESSSRDFLTFQSRPASHSQPHPSSFASQLSQSAHDSFPAPDYLPHSFGVIPHSSNSPSDVPWTFPTRFRSCCPIIFIENYSHLFPHLILNFHRFLGFISTPRSPAFATNIPRANSSVGRTPPRRTSIFSSTLHPPFFPLSPDYFPQLRVVPAVEFAFGLPPSLPVTEDGHIFSWEMSRMAVRQARRE
ncbi:hypothetical protein B0H13DRAFT_2300133 [Mycena leptocephala]|nr:hypothetical protein B0H13DRAFT_2300133 [Mycena leptocephala]